ncbi:hypothetical protein GDO86_018208 [Hymenochirus boettgeri]|uniref:G-protein coupled receptors family 1 profile domain-containing protein n=1 Tax=Hymenochirus boettgeri TaxID=247094 RepID=A0A8T2IGP3_9PIPI|nr:hypothetical protein GDO86_018208 [Hymenochirus boettgeri]
MDPEVELFTGTYDDDYYDNETEVLCPDPVLPQAYWVLPVLYSAFFLLGLTGNSVVIVIVSRRSSRRADTFILNLAISDLLFVLTLPFWAASSAMDGHWYFGIHLCRASGFIISVTRCASSLLMASMSVDRYLAVIRGHRGHPFRTRTCSLAVCCTVWMVSVITGMPSLVFRNVDEIHQTCIESSDSALAAGIKLASLVLTFILPLVVVLFCYSCMAKHLWKYFGSQQKVHLGKPKPRRRHRWLRIVSCVVAAYSLSWFPYNTLSTVKLIAELGKDFPCHTAIDRALRVAAAIAFANSCTNPLIYALLDVGFRRRTQLTMPKCFQPCCLIRPFRGWNQPSTITSTESSSSYTRSN